MVLSEATEQFGFGSSWLADNVDLGSGQEENWAVNCFPLRSMLLDLPCPAY